MAMAKAKPGVEVVFGMGKPMGKGGADETESADEAHEEATDTLKSALSDAGVDASDALMDALHQYVEACIKKPPEPMGPDSDDEGY